MNHTFSVYAPTSAGIACRCSGWNDEPRPMTRGDDGTWTLTADLPAGTHAYTYELTSLSWFSRDAVVRIADPMGRFLSPDEKSSLIHLPPSHTAEQYAWRHDERPHPAHDELAIYEVFIQDFAGPAGTFSTAQERLAMVSDLGFTAMEIMPLMGCDGQKSWGYTPCFFFAVEPRFGSEEELCRLVDEAHGQGLVVFFDGVYNHASRDCPLTHIDHDCYFHHAPKDPDCAWGPQFNFALALPGTSEFPGRHFIKQKVAHWIRLFHFDGIRYDAVSQIRDREFLYELVDWTRSLAGVKPFYSIAECLPVERELVGAQGSMDACWQEEFSKRMRSILSGQWNGDALEACFDCRRDGFISGKDIVNYLGSHDTGHTVRYLLDHGLDEAAALFRMRMGFSVLFTAMGLPMVWMGDEFGAMDPPTQEPHPVPWDLLGDERRQALRTLVKDLLALRRRTGALRGDECAVLHRDDTRQLLVIHRWDGAGGRVIVAVHGGDGDVTMTVPAPAPGHWQGVDSPGIQVDGDHLSITCGGWQAVVLIHEPAAT